MKRPLRTIAVVSIVAVLYAVLTATSADVVVRFDAAGAYTDPDSASLLPRVAVTAMAILWLPILPAEAALAVVPVQLLPGEQTSLAVTFTLASLLFASALSSALYGLHWLLWGRRHRRHA
jgi:hypothetical protein